jgi:hypothetical protein
VIRIVSIAALLCLLVLVLYLPSAHPPERFLAQIRSEHQAIEEIWGETPALRILDRALGLAGCGTGGHACAPDRRCVGGERRGRRRGAGDGFRQPAAVREQLLPRDRCSRALAAFRLSAMLEWLPWLMVAALAALVDGGIVRLIKAKEFRHHDPELFALFAGLAITAACAAVVALVIPVTMPPLLIPVVPVGVAALAALALANFHRRA